MKVCIHLKSSRYYYYKGSGDYHCKEGILKEEDLHSGQIKIQSTLGQDFLVTEMNIHDKTEKFKRGPQLMIEKDLGYILARTALSKDSVVVEAGSGSGASSAFFGRFVKEVHSYELREEHLDVAKKNVESLELKNVKFAQGDISEILLEEKDYDLLLLDLPNPDEIITEEKVSGLKKGQYVLCYLPSVSQIIALMNKLSEMKGFYVEEISEISKREWKVTERIARPEHKKEIDHTAFLVFIRKL